MKLLIVEDQEGPLEALEFAVKKVVPEYFLEFEYDVAKWYLQAKDLIEETGHDLIILDHRMPYDDPGCTDADFDRFRKTLKNIGYGLVGPIKEKNPATIVIGTSSLDPQEIGHYDPAPDYFMSKMWGEAGKELAKILEQIKQP